MESADPKPLVAHYEAAVKALAEYRKARQDYLEMQKAADTAQKLTAEALSVAEEALNKYSAAAQALEEANRAYRGDAHPDPLLAEDIILKTLRGES